MTMNNPKRLEAEWKEYEGSVIPSGAGEIQRREMRQSFYAGAISLFNLINNNISGDVDVTDDDMALMEHINEEFSMYHQELKRRAGRQDD